MRWIVTLTLMLTGPALAGPAEDFWMQLEALCGKAYEGELVEAPAEDDTLSARRLVMEVAECDTGEIRIPFRVGEDTSRTWVLTRHDGRLTLKHDHRHDDGTPHEVTGYGGTSPNPGSATLQMFPADPATAALIAPAASNVWWLRLQPDTALTYAVERLGTERRYEVRFDLTATVEGADASGQ